MSLDGKWLHFAQEDLSMARLAIREGIWNQACFHSQQAVEKLLKATLPEVSRPRTHKVADLLQLVDLDLPDELRFSLLLLDRFYIPTRYPDALPGALDEGFPNEADARESNMAAETLARLLSSAT